MELNFYFEIVADSHSVIRNNIDQYSVLFTQFLPMAVSYWYLTISWLGHWHYISSTTRIPHIDPGPALILCATITLFSISYTFVISRMLYKWNHTVCNFFWLAFFHSEWLSGDSSRSDIAWWHVSAVCSLILLSVFHGMDVPSMFSHLVTEGHVGCVHLFGYSNKHIKTFLSKFLCEHLSSFPLGKMPRRVNARSHGGYMFRFLRNCWTVSPRGCIISHFHQ